MNLQRYKKSETSAEYKRYKKGETSAEYRIRKIGAERVIGKNATSEQKKRGQWAELMYLQRYEKDQNIGLAILQNLGQHWSRKGVSGPS